MTMNNKPSEPRSQDHSRLDTSGTSVRIKPRKEPEDSFRSRVISALTDITECIGALCISLGIPIGVVLLCVIMFYEPETFSSANLQELEAERITQSDIFSAPGAVEAVALATAEAEGLSIDTSNPQLWEAGGTHYIGFVDSNAAEEGYALECVVGDAAECVIPTPDS